MQKNTKNMENFLCNVFLRKRKNFVPKSTLSNKEIGIRYGSAFGLMYLVGMQEVVVSASPFNTYGFWFVIYQFFNGLGDAIPVPVLVWTIIFGVVLGVMYLIIRPIYNDKNNTKKIIQIVILTIGVNWIWFNCFIGLILDGMFLKMLSRSLIDVVFVTFSCLAADVVITKKKRR